MQSKNNQLSELSTAMHEAATHSHLSWVSIAQRASEYAPQKRMASRRYFYNAHPNSTTDRNRAANTRDTPFIYVCMCV